MKLKEYLKNKIPESKLQYLPSSFDIIGSICVIELKPEIKRYSKLIGNLILKLNPSIKSVFRKSSKIKGKHRTHKLTYISGINTKKTIHKENNTLLKLNIEKCYFSPRLNNERLRVSRLVKKNESILVMFSGIGVYNFVILKNSSPKEVFGIEINKTAHKYALENIKLNKIPESKIKLYNGDVKKALPKINKKFDRIIMPLPKDSLKYLNLALKKAKKNGIIHLYTFLEEGKEKDLKEKLKNKKLKILKIVSSGVYAPRINRVCVDIKVL
ncbi:MAG: methyltransferase domain-containing protein [Nanoarchaeota archaeon]